MLNNMVFTARRYA